MEWCRIQGAGSSYINQQSRKAPKDVVTGNPDLDLDSPLI